MKLSSFEEIIRLQFNAYMMITIKGTVRYRRKQRIRRLEHEALFCEIPEIKQNSQNNYDSYSIDFSVFQVWNFSIKVSDEKLGTALHKSNVTISCYTIFKICGTERLRSFTMYHILL